MATTVFINSWEFIGGFYQYSFSRSYSLYRFRINTSLEETLALGGWFRTRGWHWWLGLWAGVDVLWQGRKGDRCVAYHLARGQVEFAGGQRLRVSTRRPLEYEGLAIGGLVEGRRTTGRTAGDSTQLALEENEVAFHVTDGGAADEAEFVTALFTVFIFDGVQNVGQGIDTFIQTFLVLTVVVC